MLTLRIKSYLMNRKARRIRDTMVELDITRIVVTQYDVEIWFSDDDETEQGMVMQEFRHGTPVKKFLRKYFGNYTGGGLY